MKIAIIGSTQYKDRIILHAEKMLSEGHEVLTPAFDDHDTDALGIMTYNRTIIEWADEVHVIWDCRSVCTWGDFCMAFALRKPVKAIYLEPKLMKDVILEYEKG